LGAPATPADRIPFVLAVILASAVGVLAVGILTGTAAVVPTALVVLASLAAIALSVGFVTWTPLIGALILIILFVPMRRYYLPVDLPFGLEPYRIFIAVLLLGWCASLLVDDRTRFRRTGFEAPIICILVATIASIVANAERVAPVSSYVDKKLMFFLSFVLVVYLISSVIRRVEDVDILVRTLVVGGTVVAFFGIVEARTGFNVFNHIAQIVPVLQYEEIPGPSLVRFGAAKLRIFGSAEHPIALSALFVMLTPLAVYLARRHKQRRWMLCAIVLAAACAATVSRTGILMLVVVVLVYVWLRPRDTIRLWPAVVVALVIVKVALPGTLGAIKNSFQPPGGLIAEQQMKPGEVGSGRLADLGPGIAESSRQPLLGQGYGTRIIDPDAGVTPASILDNQWLGTLLETGAVGLAAWLWFFVVVVRRLGKEAKRDDSERGWLLASLAAAVAAYAVGMFTYDAFSFTQVTFVLFTIVGLGSAALADASRQPAPSGGRRVAPRLPKRSPLPESAVAGRVELGPS
jgi:O-antigen ligase